MKTIDINFEILSLEHLHSILIKLSQSDTGDSDWEDYYGVDLTSLPTFGGDEPADTTAIWSWDEDRILCGRGSVSEWEILNRNDQFDILKS